MAVKEIVFGVDAREKMLKGVALLSKAVKATLGPRGRNVVIEKKWGSPTITKDGVSVANEIVLEDPFENIGAQMVKEVASKTSDVAGDGTTTATVLAEAIYEFTRTMQSYKSIIAENTTLVLSTDSDLFKFLKGMTPVEGIASARRSNSNR